MLDTQDQPVEHVLYQNVVLARLDPTVDLVYVSPGNTRATQGPPSVWIVKQESIPT